MTSAKLRFLGRAERSLLDRRDRAYQWAAPHAVRLAAHLARSTVARLEYPHRPEVRWGWGRPPHPWFAGWFAAGVGGYRDVIDNIVQVLPDLRSVAREPRPGRPAWENDFFAPLDAATLYAILVRQRPRTFLEVGSGYSTLFARQAVTDHDLATRIVSVDPAPRADVDAVCDEMHRAHLADADPALFHRLEPGDVVFVDGSHTCFMGSDTVVAWLDVLPAVPPGVLVGIHDVFLPWDYPPTWADRWYGEQYLIGALLLARPRRWRVHFPAWYVSHETDLGRDLAELWEMSGFPADWGGAALWLEAAEEDVAA